MCFAYSKFNTPNFRLIRLLQHIVYFSTALILFVVILVAVIIFLVIIHVEIRPRGQDLHCNILVDKIKYGQTTKNTISTKNRGTAGDGFAITENYAWAIEFYAQRLRRTEYGQRTFFPNDTALQPGDILRQPEFAELLTKLAEQGSGYMYAGEWAVQCVETVRSERGK